MIRFLNLFLIALLFAGHAHGGVLSLHSAQVNNGDVAVLQWRGEPLSFGVVRYQDDVLYLYPDPQGAIALLPVGLDMAAGDYLLQVALVDKFGRTTAEELTLTVTHKERPLEKLTLPPRMVTPSAEDQQRIAQENALLNQVFAGRSERFWTVFERPVDEPVSSVFGKRRLMNGMPRSPHSGTDFRSPQGTPVRAMSNGRVALVADLFYTGKSVVVDHGEGLFSLYAHLSKVLVGAGHDLIVGDVLGEVGSTGRSTGAHLHLTVKLLGERVDPLSLLAFEQ